jgi:hypothetical protein
MADPPAARKARVESLHYVDGFPGLGRRGFYHQTLDDGAAWYFRALTGLDAE